MRRSVEGRPVLRVWPRTPITRRGHHRLGVIGIAPWASVQPEELAAGLDEATMEKWRAAALERFELEAERS